MKRHDNNAITQVTELLLMPDGAVLADRLTPAMAALLRKIHLHPAPHTQCSLLGEVRVDRPAIGTPESGTQQAP